MGTKQPLQKSWGLADVKPHMATQRATCVTAITFGPMTIPIRVFTGSRRGKLPFKQLHGKDGGKLQQTSTCGTCNETVAFADQGKGYEHAKGEYLVLDATEIKALEFEGKALKIQHFCPAGQIDSSREAGDVSLLAPDKGAEQPYQLLCQAMVKDKIVGIGRFTSRGKCTLVCLRPGDHGGIVMVPLYYADELRDFSGVNTGDGLKLEKEAFGLVRRYMTTITRDFDPNQHPDLHKDAVEALVRDKLEGKEPRIVTVTEHTDVSMPIVDLVGALKASLLEAEAPPDPKPAKRASRKAPTAKPRRKTANGRAVRA